MTSTFLNDFNEFYKNTLKPRLIEKYSGNNSECTSINNLMKRFDEVIEYNTPHGKKMRGMCTLQSIDFLINSSISIDYLKKTSKHELLNQAMAIGWCIEFLQASLLVADDIMDNSTMRRNQLCWYLIKSNGLMAINDSFYLLACVFSIIRLFVSNHPMYTKFYELFTDTFERTVIGQGLDLITPPTKETLETNNGHFDFTNYTQERYDAIVKWKTAFYSFSLPFKAGLYLSCIDDVDLHAKCDTVLLKLGAFFQIQDDYLDCYGDPSVTGKVGTDIEEGKCSWLIVQALRLASQEQISILQNHFGKQEPDSVKKVKHIYETLNLKSIYEKFEETEFFSIIEKIKAMNGVDKTESSEIQLMLMEFASKIFKRQK